LYSGYSTHKNRDDTNNWQGPDANIGALVHKFFPVHFHVFRFGKHAFQHEQVLSYVFEYGHGLVMLQDTGCRGKRQEGRPEYEQRISDKNNEQGIPNKE
jgi:hypothetical protein